MLAMIRGSDAMATKTHDQGNRSSVRKVVVVLVLFAIVFAFYIGSFLLIRG